MFFKLLTPLEICTIWVSVSTIQMEWFVRVFNNQITIQICSYCIKTHVLMLTVIEFCETLIFILTERHSLTWSSGCWQSLSYGQMRQSSSWGKRLAGLAKLCTIYPCCLLAWQVLGYATKIRTSLLPNNKCNSFPSSLICDIIYFN